MERFDSYAFSTLFAVPLNAINVLCREKYFKGTRLYKLKQINKKLSIIDKMNYFPRYQGIACHMQVPKFRAGQKYHSK